GVDMDVDSFSPGQDALSKSPAPTHGLAGQEPGKRQAGWPSLLVTFLLATQEKSDSVAEGDRPLLVLNAAKSIARKRAPTGAGGRKLLALNGAKGIARERAPAGAKRVAPSANHTAGPRP
ncbi:MAG TPA: hypothetical protein VN624_18780, partial [Rhodanobacter sp.]|nr:hypothetical protein [Rhodanobacter sp.]